MALSHGIQAAQGDPWRQGGPGSWDGLQVAQVCLWGQVGVWDWSQVAQVFPWGQVGSRACKIPQTVKAI